MGQQISWQPEAACLLQVASSSSTHVMWPLQAEGMRNTAVHCGLPLPELCPLDSTSSHRNAYPAPPTGLTRPSLWHSSSVHPPYPWPFWHTPPGVTMGQPSPPWLRCITVRLHTSTPNPSASCSAPPHVSSPILPRAPSCPSLLPQAPPHSPFLCLPATLTPCPGTPQPSPAAPRQPQVDISPQRQSYLGSSRP